MSFNEPMPVMGTCNYKSEPHVRWACEKLCTGWTPLTAAPTGSTEPQKCACTLISFLERNKIVGVLLDTEQHRISIDILKLPPEIKPVLTLWGSIYVRNEPDSVEARQDAARTPGKE